MKVLRWMVLFLHGHLLLWVTADEEVVIHTKFGKVIGVKKKPSGLLGSDIDGVNQYLGLPYAQPPTGHLRFKRPLPLRTKQRVFNATVSPSVCPQYPISAFQAVSAWTYQSEDCLFLNIFAPYQANRTSERYPVLFYIHGGSYKYGTCNLYNGYILAHQGVLVVTINYRLDILGFFTTGNEAASGNYGVWDQVEALKWVRDNIASFQGDPNKITIWGNSAGASSVGLLLVSPATKGLFHAAILQSGSPLAEFAHYNHTAKLQWFSREVLRMVGCRHGDLAVEVNCLRRIDPKPLIQAYWKYPRISHLGIIYKPWIDGLLLPDAPSKLIKSGHFHQVPVMVGYVQDEWAVNLGWFLHKLHKSHPELDQTYWDGIDISTLIKGIHNVLENYYWWPDVVSDAAVKMYTDHNTSDTLENLRQYIQFTSDLIMVAPGVRLAAILAEQNIPVYQYLFDHKPAGNGTKLTKSWWGVFHSIDLNYAFGSPFTGQNVALYEIQSYSERDREVSKQVMKYWTNFVKYGAPCAFAQCATAKWTQMNAHQGNYMYISGNGSRMRDHLRHRRMQLWNVEVPRLIESWKEAQQRTKQRDTLDMATWTLVGVAAFVVLVFVIVFTLYIKQRKKNKLQIKREDLTQRKIKLPTTDEVSQLHGEPV